jgi:FKBP-type peptidyl-prolyl cis-trans isomerase
LRGMRRVALLAGAAVLVLGGCRQKVAPAPARVAPAAVPEVGKPAVDAGGAPVDVKAVPADAQKTASGLAFRVLVVGSGKVRPKATDTVKILYTGWTRYGRMFDSALDRDRPPAFTVDRMIKGLSEGLQLMVVGEKRRFWIPAALAYGDAPAGAGTPSGMLVFDVELLDVDQPPPVPPELARALKTATTTPSGLAYRVLKRGRGHRRPQEGSTVVVHYTGWTIDGKMFESSQVQGRPVSFPVRGVMPGWREGLQMMLPGEKRRLWIPPRLAYGEPPPRPDIPTGTLVFDIELVAIE